MLVKDNSGWAEWGGWDRMDWISWTLVHIYISNFLAASLRLYLGVKEGYKESLVNIIGNQSKIILNLASCRSKLRIESSSHICTASPCTVVTLEDMAPV